MFLIRFDCNDTVISSPKADKFARSLQRIYNGIPLCKRNRELRLSSKEVITSRVYLISNLEESIGHVDRIIRSTFPSSLNFPLTFRWMSNYLKVYHNTRSRSFLLSFFTKSLHISMIYLVHVSVTFTHLLNP